MINDITNKIMKAAMAALLAGVPFIQSVPVLAKEKDPEPEVEDYDYFEEYWEDDWGTEFAYEDEYDWLDEYETLTDQEKEKVKEVLDQIYDVYDEMLACYDDEGYVLDEVKLGELEKKEEELWDSIADIQKKMNEEDIEKGKAFLAQFITENEYLTEEEKEEYLAVLDKIFDLGKEFEGLFDENFNVTDEKKLDALVDELNALLDELSNLDGKITVGEMNDSEELTEQEKATLMEGYAKLDELYEKEDACFDKEGNLIKGKEQEYERLCEEEEKIMDSIWDLEMKMYSTDLFEV